MTKDLTRQMAVETKEKNHLDFTSVLKYITLQIVYYNKILKHAGVALHRNLCVLSEVRYSEDYSR